MCDDYLIRVDSNSMNEFENYLVSNNICYTLSSINMENARVAILYSINTDSSTMMMLSLLFPLGHIINQT